jgi:hypothetical protein
MSCEDKVNNDSHQIFFKKNALGAKNINPVIFNPSAASPLRAGSQRDLRLG